MFIVDRVRTSNPPEEAKVPITIISSLVRQHGRDPPDEMSTQLCSLKTESSYTHHSDSCTISRR